MATKSAQVIVIALCCPPLLNGMMIVEDHTHTLIAGHTEVNAELSSKVSPSWLLFTVLEGTGGDKTS